jgi:putative (di)nucleoside polyphosphate hydrolase
MNPLTEAPKGYRPCAGAAVFNADGHVFVGCRIDQNPKDDYAWQMPQGGLDAGEDPEHGARRELYEETGIRSVTLLSASDDWLTYDFPPEILGKRFKKHKGQAQRWYAMDLPAMTVKSILHCTVNLSFGNGNGCRS